MYEKYKSLMDEELTRTKFSDTQFNLDEPNRCDMFSSNSKHFKINKKIVCIANQKGGCGKTTTAVNLSSFLAREGYKVLLIDLDPQAQASLGLGVNPSDITFTIYNVLMGGVDFKRAVLTTNVEGLNLLASNALLSGAPIELATQIGRESILKFAIQNVLINKPYDFVIIDCSPALNLLAINALVAADYVIIPIQTHYYSLEGMKEFLHTIDMVKDRLNSRLQILGVLVTLFDKRNRINNEILSQVRNYFDDLVFDTVIRINVKLSEAPIHNKPIYEYAAKSYGAIDYQNLAQEVKERINSIQNNNINPSINNVKYAK